MNIEWRIRQATDLTPTEQQLAQVVLAMGDRIQTASIKEFARAASVSIATVHRFCRKIGLEGFKELKIELARSRAESSGEAMPVDINFPFSAGDDAQVIVPRIRSIYEETIRDTCELLDPGQLERAAGLVGSARRIGIYTQSHNIYPAEMFCDRLMSIGRDAFCHERLERQYRAALAADERDLAILISYSGLTPEIGERIDLLTRRNVPIVFVGTPGARLRHPGLAAYLLVSDREHYQDRITQLASHIAVQFVLDALFSCVFANDYDASAEFLKGFQPYESESHVPAKE